MLFLYGESIVDDRMSPNSAGLCVEFDFLVSLNFEL